MPYVTVHIMGSQFHLIRFFHGYIPSIHGVMIVAIQLEMNHLFWAIRSLIMMLWQVAREQGREIRNAIVLNEILLVVYKRTAMNRFTLTWEAHRITLYYSLLIRYFLCLKLLVDSDRRSSAYYLEAHRAYLRYAFAVSPARSRQKLWTRALY